MSKKVKRILKKNACQICRAEFVTAPEVICKQCSIAMAIVTDLLGLLGVLSEHPMFPEYTSAVFKALKEKQDVLHKQTGQRVVFSALAILEGAEAHNGNRERGNYILYMSQDNVIKAFFYDSEGRMPNDEEFKIRKENIGNAIRN